MYLRQNGILVDVSNLSDVRCAQLAREAGYDGVEIMGSEGYFINEFLVTHTNQRTDPWGGDYAQRMRFPVEIVERTREAVGDDFIIIYRRKGEAKNSSSIPARIWPGGKSVVTGSSPDAAAR